MIDFQLDLFDTTPDPIVGVPETTDLDEFDDEMMEAALVEPPPAALAAAEEIAPADSWAEVQGIATGLRDLGVTGHDDVVPLLAVLSSRAYRAMGHGPRILLTAPPSAGKTFLLVALAETLGLPCIHVDASTIAPEGWAGTNISDLLTRCVSLSKRPFDAWERGAVLVLDEIDKACRAHPDDRYGTAVRLERQFAMLQLLWGGTPIRLTDGRTLRTDSWIVVACGAFAAAPFTAARRIPTDADLLEWGMSPELASRLPTRFALRARDRAQLIELLRTDARGLPQAAHVARSFGCTLTVPETTLACLAAAMLDERAGYTVRTASQCLVDAVIRRVVQLGPMSDTDRALVIAPDDLHIRRAPPAKRERPFGDDALPAPT